VYFKENVKERLAHPKVLSRQQSVQFLSAKVTYGFLAALAQNKPAEQ